jgi:hypothetical protein
MKKICFYILIISFLNFIGCYSSRSVNKEILYTSDLGEPAGVVTIITNNEERIVLDEGNYELVGDTLYVNGINKTNTTVYGHPIDVKIALDDIHSTEIEEFDGWATTGCVMGVASLAIIIVGVIAMANSDYSTNSCQSGDYAN